MNTTVCMCCGKPTESKAFVMSPRGNIEMVYCEECSDGVRVVEGWSAMFGSNTAWLVCSKHTSDTRVLCAEDGAPHPMGDLDIDTFPSW